MSDVNTEVEVNEEAAPAMTHEEQAKDFYEPEVNEESNEEDSSAKSLATGDDNEAENDSEESTNQESEDSKKDEVADEKEESKDEKEADEFTLELGEESHLDESFLKDVESFAKEKGLSKEVAQEWVAKQEAFIADQLEQAQEIEDQQIEEWRQSVIDDPKWGGDNLKKTVADAQKIVTRFGGEDLINLLNETGYGNHPAVVTFLAQIGGLASEDSLILPGAEMAKEKSVEELFYGN